MATLYTFLALCLIAGATALDTNCADVKAQKNFDLCRYSGIWYVREAYISTSRPYPGVSCRKLNIILGDNGESFKIVNYGVQRQYSGRIFIKYNETAHIFYHPDPARFKIRDDVADNVESDELVLATDYNFYAVTYRCPQESGGRIVSILTREIYPSTMTLNKINKIVKKNYIDKWSYAPVDQTDCAGQA